MTLCWLARFGLGLALALGLVVPALANTPDGQTAQTAISISDAVDGNVNGSGAGGFVYYTFKYAGDGSEGTVTLTFSPSDPVTASAIGVNLWQGSSLLATMSGRGSSVGSNSMTFSSSTPGSILAQVYSYASDVPVSFQLTLSGVNQDAPAPPPAPDPPAGDRDNPIPLTTSLTGGLGGNWHGAYTYYKVDYPGHGSRGTITLDFYPNDPDTANAVYVEIFQNGSLLAGLPGQQAKTAGHLQVSASSGSSEPMVVRVANYFDYHPLSYTISYTTDRNPTQ